MIKYYIYTLNNRIQMCINFNLTVIKIYSCVHAVLSESCPVMSKSLPPPGTWTSARGPRAPSIVLRVRRAGDSATRFRALNVPGAGERPGRGQGIRCSCLGPRPRLAYSAALAPAFSRSPRPASLARRLLLKAAQTCWSPPCLLPFKFFRHTLESSSFSIEGPFISC